MLCETKKIIWLNILLVILILQQYGGETKILMEQSSTNSNLAEKLLSLLTKLGNTEGKLDMNTKFALLLGEFLMKQKVRFYESTRYEEQAYYHILQNLNTIIQKNNNEHFVGVQKSILDNVFQRGVLLIRPALQQGHIDTHREYRSLIGRYDKLVDTGLPNRTLSDLCLNAVVTLDSSNCNLRNDCMNVITTDLPTFGYHRMHQILLLFVFMHHRCSQNFGPQSAYEILARDKCTQAYREQKVIRELDIPLQYRDLYLEQNVVCGLFGYTEFLNWHNVQEMMSWNYDADSIAEYDFRFRQKCSMHKLHSNCNNHIDSLALVYYINALLLLN